MSKFENIKWGEIDMCVFAMLYFVPDLALAYVGGIWIIDARKNTTLAMPFGLLGNFEFPKFWH